MCLVAIPGRDGARCAQLGADITRAQPDASQSDAILDDLGRRAFAWFERNRDEATGLVLDRAPNAEQERRRSNVASIASVGFYLSMLPEAVRLGQIDRAAAEGHARLVLHFLRDHGPQHDGLFYHFMDASSGRQTANSEVSALDSAIFFNGCMVVGRFFGGDVAPLADELLDRADWQRFVVKHSKTGKPVLSFGWKPGEGLLGGMQVRSSEIAMAYFLATGSRTHPIDPQCWYNTEVRRGKVAGLEVLNPTQPLFTSYYGLCWHNLSGKVDREGGDLDANAREAALANRAFCREMAGRFSTYSVGRGGWWGLSAGDSPRGYEAVGPVEAEVDGTVWPVAALAALPWVPEELNRDLIQWHVGPDWSAVAGAYGVAPFNADRKWVGRDLIGIDLGSFYLNLANLRHGTVRDLWMSHPIARSALSRLGYRAREALRISMYSGAAEYHSDQTLAGLKRYLERQSNVRCTLNQVKDIHDLPGIEQLGTCDVMVVFARRLELPAEQVAQIRRYMDEGKPVVGIRTASHAFQTWLAFDHEVLGGDYHGHAEDKFAKVQISSKAKDHPALAGVEPFTTTGKLYSNPHVADDVTVLLTATSGDNTQPVAWARTRADHHNQRVFYTSLGTPEDFQNENFRKLVGNAIVWAAVREPARGDELQIAK